MDELKSETEQALKGLDTGMPKSEKVKISERSGGRISVSKLKPRLDPPNLDALKAEIGRRSSTTSLLDVFKEADLRVGFTELFETMATREVLDRDTLRRRLLLVSTASVRTRGSRGWPGRIPMSPNGSSDGCA